MWSCMADISLSILSNAFVAWFPSDWKEIPRVHTSGMFAIRLTRVRGLPSQSLCWFTKLSVPRRPWQKGYISPRWLFLLFAHHQNQNNLETRTMISLHDFNFNFMKYLCYFVRASESFIILKCYRKSWHNGAIREAGLNQCQGELLRYHSNPNWIIQWGR